MYREKHKLTKYTEIKHATLTDGSLKRTTIKRAKIDV